jgi:hypothetical protein
MGLVIKFSISSGATKSSVQNYKVMGPIESPIVGDKAKNKEFLFGISLQD